MTLHSLVCPLLTSCCMAQFPTGHRPVLQVTKLCKSLPSKSWLWFLLTSQDTQFPLFRQSTNILSCQLSNRLKLLYNTSSVFQQLNWEGHLAYLIHHKASDRSLSIFACQSNYVLLCFLFNLGSRLCTRTIIKKIWQYIQIDGIMN